MLHCFVWFASNYPKYPSIEESFAQEKIEFAQSAEEKMALENEKAQQLLEKEFFRHYR